MGRQSCHPRGVSSAGPTRQPPAQAPSPAIERANRMSAANMLRSLLPLVLLCLLVVGWQAFRTDTGDPVREVDPTGSIRLAESRASYPLLVPTELPDGYRPTSVRTDAGSAAEGAPVTLQLGYVTPAEKFAGFVVTDAPRSEAVTKVLAGATEEGTVDLDGAEWTRSTTERGETALSRIADGVTVVVSGSAPDAELETVADAVGPWSG